MDARLERAMGGLHVGMLVEVKSAYWADGEEMDMFGGCAGYVRELSAADVKLEMLNGEDVWLPARRIKL